MDWYYHKDGERLGPISDEEFNAAVAAGHITGETLVWNEDMPEWQPYSLVSAEAGNQAPETVTEPPALPQGLVSCRECVAQGAPETMTPYGDQWICSNCKETFFQRIKEGVSINAGRRLGTGGATSNSELVARAKETLSDNWGPAIGASAIFSVIMMSISSIPYIGPFVGMFVTPPLKVGHNRFYLRFIRSENPDAGVVFSGFSQFGTALIALLLRNIAVGLMATVAMMPPLIVFIAFAVKNNQGGGSSQGLFIALMILSLLWFIAGLVVTMVFTFKWMMIEWIIADNPDVPPLDTFRMSSELMAGNKMKAFFLGLHFLGWALLALLTCCIGYLFLVPYVQTAFAYFYEDIQDPE